MEVFNPIYWYALSPHTSYTAKQVQNFKSGEIIKPPNGEFKSDEYICRKNINQQGIYRYGVTNGVLDQNMLVDFYILNSEGGDFHYKSNIHEYVYDIAIKFIYTNSEGSEEYKVDNLSQYLTLSRAQQKINPIVINDIFVHKYGHMDISLKEEKEMIQDGYSIGYRSHIIIAENRSADICIRGNMDLKANKPFFQCIIVSDFDCDVEVECNSTDIEIDTSVHTKHLKAGDSGNFMIAQKKLRENEQKILKVTTIIDEYRNIARYINWNYVPKEFHIDWNNDSLDDISQKFFLYDKYLHEPKQINDKKILETKLFTVYDRVEHPIIYHNRKLNGYVDIEFSLFGKRINITRHPLNYIIKDQGSVLKLTGIIGADLHYELYFCGSDICIPKIYLTLISRFTINEGYFKIDSDFVYKEAGKIEFKLNKEKLSFETKD